MEALQKRLAMKTETIFLIILFIMSFHLKAQDLPIDIIYNQANYSIYDTLNVILKNRDNKPYRLKVGIDKLNAYRIWEVVTTNILLSKAEIEGEIKGDLSYYLASQQSVFIDFPITEINIPLLLRCDEEPNIKNGHYRISISKNTEFNEVMTGLFRFSIKCTVDINQLEYMVVKTTPFRITPSCP